MWQSFTSTQAGITRITGVCGMLIPVVVFSCLGLSIASSPWFTWTQHALSDLGIQGSTAALFNNGMILGGILSFVFSLGLMKVLSNKLGAYLLLLSSLALIGIGVFPETLFVLHFVTSASFFILLSIALLIIGLTSRQNHFDNHIGLLAVILACIAVSSLVLLFPFEGIAIAEALSCFPAFIWCSIVGLKMIWTSV